MAAQGQRDYYKILGISRNADEKEIKRAFRRLARKYHPDVNPGDKEAESKFKEASEAYEVLRDPEKRRPYDQYGHLGDMWQHVGAGVPGGVVYRTAASGADYDFSGFGGLDDLLKDLVGGGAQTVTRRRRGEDVQVQIDLTLEEAFRTTPRQINVPVRQMCPACQGAGLVGRGAACTTCRGQGQLEQVKRLDVKIPAGVQAGSKIRLAGQGMMGSSGQPGDLYLIPNIALHQFFRRQGDDLHCEVPVTYSEAVLGAEIEVPTLNGSVTTKLPAGTSSGRQLRLSGKGMPHMKGGGSGDMYVRIRIVVPSDLTKEEKDLIGRLGELRRGSPRSNLRP